MKRSQRKKEGANKLLWEKYGTIPVHQFLVVKQEPSWIGYSCKYCECKSGLSKEVLEELTPEFARCSKSPVRQVVSLESHNCLYDKVVEKEGLERIEEEKRKAKEDDENCEEPKIHEIKNEY